MRLLRPRQQQHNTHYKHMENAVYFLIAGLNERASQAKCPGYGHV